MLVEVAKKLDEWMEGENAERKEEGTPQLRPCTLHLVGQAALLENDVEFPLQATNDVDIRSHYDHAIQVELRRLLREVGMDLDPVGHEVWMPPETTYATLFEGDNVTLKVADIEAVLISKALKAPTKNRILIIEYLATGPSARFMALAHKYKVDLDQFTYDHRN